MKPQRHPYLIQSFGTMSQPLPAKSFTSNREASPLTTHAIRMKRTALTVKIPPELLIFPSSIALSSPADSVLSQTL